MKFINYYYDKDPSKSSFYEDCYLNLKKQLNSFGHELIADNIDFERMGLSAYDKLNLYKPTFILEKLDQLQEPVAWIDADTNVYGAITEFQNLDCDIAFATREHDGKTPHAALIYFGNTKKSREFLTRWKELCDDKRLDLDWKCTEHCILVDLFNELTDSFKIINFYNLASISRNTKVKIGISPAGWEYERNKNATRI